MLNKNLCLMFVIIISFTVLSIPVFAVDTTFSYENVLQITDNSGINVTDYPIIFWFNHDGNSNSECSDIRIVNITDNSTIPFGIRNCNSTYAELVTRTNLIANANNYMHIYYGNQTSSNFINSTWNDVRYNFWDEFSTDKGWTCASGTKGHWRVDTTIGKIEYEDWAFESLEYCYIDTGYNFTNNWKLDFSSNLTYEESLDRKYVFGLWNTTEIDTTGFPANNGGHISIMANRDPTSLYSSLYADSGASEKTNISTNILYKYSIINNNSGIYKYANGVSEGNVNLPYDQNLFYLVGTGENAAGPVVENRRGRGLIDDVYISKFVNNEPTFLLTNITSIYMNPIFSGFEWEIKDIQCCGGLEIDQGYVENDKYTTVQAEPREGGIRLDITNKQFNAGDILEYDVDYNSLSGNAMSRIVINGQRLDDLICCWRGAIGYWDQDMSFGNQVGTYHVKINFLGNDVLIDVTRPNGGTIVSESVSLPAPYTFGFETRTGANGACNFTYHNFIYDKQSPQWSDAIPGLNTTPIIQYAPNQDYTFNITWIDNAQVNEVSFTFNDTIYNFSEGEIIKTGDMYSIILTDLSAGDYYYEWYGRDVSGNWNSTGIWTFDLQKGAIIPDLSIVPLSPIMYGTETTATCISNNPEQTVKLMRNGADVDATENGVSVILSSGEHDYECHAEQTQNYTGTGCGMDDYTVLDFATNSYGVDLVRNIHKQTVGKDEIATYLLNITNLGDVQDTFDLIIDKNPRDATVILNTTTIMLGINQTEYIEMKISSSEIGAYSVWIKATSQSDVNVSDSVQTVTIVKGNENSNIDDDNVIEDSAIESSTINSSTINQTFVNSSLIIGSTITNTEIISSNVSNTNLNGIILINADVKNNNINSGNITINNLEFKITEEQTINDIISKRIEESLINADKDEEKEFGVGVKVNIMPNKRYSGGSLEITEHIIPSKGASKVSNSLNYFTIESSTNIVDAMIKSIVKIPYLNKENLKVRYYNEASGQWEDVAITISNNYISFETTHFSEYVLSGTEIIVEETPASVSLGGGGGGGIGIPDDEDEIKDEENDIEEENNDINSEDTDDKITEETVGSGITGMILGDTDITTLGIAIIVLIGLGGIFYYFKKFKPKFKKIKFNIKKR